MSLKIICGRAGCGKSRYMLNDMDENANAVYIVPEQFSFSAEKKLIEKFGVVGLGGPQVLSFMRLAHTVFSRYGSPEFIADNASFEMLVSYCADSLNPEKLRLFNGLVKKSELAETASALITTFKKYRITPEKLRFAIERTESTLLKKKLTDSLTIYEEYLSELSNTGFADQNDTLAVLADIFADEDCDFLKGKTFYIDQFSDFDPSEYECIRQMLIHSERVCIALCTDGSEQFETINRTYRRLVSIAKECNVKIEPVENLETPMFAAKPMLRHLEACYFEDIKSAFAGNDGSISIFCGKNKFSEIHNAAKEIIRLVRDEGMRYKDISIIARDAELYKGIIDRVFPFYDIPAFVDRKLPLSGHSITVFITSILDLAIGGFSYENIFTYIKSPFSPISDEDADILENYCLATGVRYYSWAKPFTANNRIYSSESTVKDTKFTPEYMEKINSLRSDIYKSLSSLINSLKKQSTVYELTDCLFSFFKKIKLESKIKKYAIMLEEHGENIYALQTVQVYNILVDIFNDICNVLGKKTVSIQRFYKIVQSGLNAVEIGTIPVSSDCVTIGSIDRIKGHGAKAVFIVGANSGIFPGYPTENGIFTDDDKILLESYGIEMPPGLLQMAQSEQLLIYDAITCASHKLCISYASADSTARAMVPSEIVERIMAIFPDISFSEDLIESDDSVKSITTKKAVFDMLCSKLREYVNEGKVLSPAMSAAAYYFSKDEVYSPLLNQAIELTSYKNSSAKVYESLIKEAIGEDMKTSITRLEAYNKCPFSYFAKYILKLEPKQTFDIKVSDSGSFLHDFLDMFSMFISNSTDNAGNRLSWKTIDDDFIKINTPTILEKVLAGVNSHMLEMPRIKALFERLCRTAEKSVYAIRQHIIKSDFIPMGYEISFDEEGNFKPIKITLADGKKVVLRGRIDRADEFSVTLPDGETGKFVRIIDYKSGDKSLTLSDVYHGVQLQLFVYLSALCSDGYSPAGILYCNLSDPMIEVSHDSSEEEILKKKQDVRRMDGIVLSEYNMLDHMGGKDMLKTKQTATAKNFNSMFKHINKVIVKTASNIYSGHFPVKCTEDACTWCEYAQLCRFDPVFSGCSKNEIPKMSDEEIWSLLRTEVEEIEMD